jgi:thiopeptide-type bacteriocin biosynthesis protein
MAVAASARGEGESFEDELRGWRERWRVPRRVNLGTEADKRLLLDLEAPAHQAELRRVLERLEPGVGVGAEEVLPELAETWVEGPGGRYVAEAVVPLVLRARAPRPVPGIPRRTATDDQRMATPGGAWLYMKAYGPRALQDRLLLAIAPLVDRAIEEEVVRAWHFVRYADPEPHLRLRFTGRPDALLHEALPRLTRHLRRAVRDGACTRLCIDTYEREVERYGGAAGMAIAERAFGIDTRAVVDLIALVHARRAPLDETLLAALSVDDFLRAFDDVGADVRGDGPPPADRHGAGPVFRALQPQLRRCLGDPAALRGSPGGRELSRILAERRLALGAVARDLRRADARGHIAVASSQLCATLVHLHLNRMIAPTARREAELLDLVRRTRVSLRRQPIDGDPELGPALTGA